MQLLDTLQSSPLLLWMRGTNSGLAFAEVQRHFAGRRKITAHPPTRVGGTEIVDCRSG